MPTPVQEPGAVQATACKGAGSRVGGLLHAEPEERRPVLRSELKADGAVDH